MDAAIKLPAAPWLGSSDPLALDYLISCARACGDWGCPAGRSWPTSAGFADTFVIWTCAIPEMGKAELELFLTSLAVERHASSRTQNQSLSALQFLYKQVLQDYRGQDQVPGPIFLTTMFSIRAH